MGKIKYKKVDAFTNGNSLGNPAACLILGDKKLSDEEMLQIGKEHSGFVSEVVFVNSSDIADCKLTYFSSECEVEFCGHGTIATMYEFIRNNPALMEKAEVKIETNRKGILTVYNELEKEDAVYITSPETKELELSVSKSEILSALEIDESVLDSTLPIDHIEAGLKTLIVPVKKLADEISIWPDEEKLKVFVLSKGMENILIFSMETEDKNCIAHTRVFAPKFGYLEDPATGSSNSAFARYLLKNNLWNGTAACLEQGGNDRVFNKVKIKEMNGCILFGGSATLKIEGEYFID